MIARAVALGLLLASTAAAQLPGTCKGVLVRQDGATVGCASILDLASLGFALPVCSAGVCTIDLQSTVSRLGSSIDGTELSGTLTYTGNADFTGGTFKIPLGTGTQPTADAQIRLNDDLDRVEVGSDAARTLRYMPGYAPRVLGGVEATNTFTYAGEVTSPTDCSAADTGCSRTVCRCGICTGSNGSGTCTLAYNSSLGRSGELASPPNLLSTVLNVKTFTHTAGTITLQAVGSSVSNVHMLVIRVRDDATFSGGTLSTKGKNSAGTTGGTRLSTTAGKAGGVPAILFPLGTLGGHSAGGNTSGSAGAAGVPVDLDAATLAATPGGLMLSVGGGGGGAPVTGNAAAGNITHPQWGGWVLAGAGGGGGGGCAGSATGSSGAGGAGGAGILIEVGGKATFSSGYVIDAMGDDGGANGGGGGGGGVQIIASEISGTVTQDTGTCTATTPRCCVGGGAGGASGGNCGAGGAGADNICVVQQAPR